jgi:hypothetical protein
VQASSLSFARLIVPLLVLRLFRGGAIPKGVLHNAKIFPEGFMVSLGFQAVDNPVDL